MSCSGGHHIPAQTRVMRRPSQAESWGRVFGQEEQQVQRLEGRDKPGMFRNRKRFAVKERVVCVEVKEACRGQNMYNCGL